MNEKLNGEWKGGSERRGERGVGREGIVGLVGHQGLKAGPTSPSVISLLLNIKCREEGGARGRGREREVKA